MPLPPAEMLHHAAEHLSTVHRLDIRVTVDADTFTLTGERVSSGQLLGHVAYLDGNAFSLRASDTVCALLLTTRHGELVDTLPLLPSWTPDTRGLIAHRLGEVFGLGTYRLTEPDGRILYATHDRFSEPEGESEWLSLAGVPAAQDGWKTLPYRPGALRLAGRLTPGAVPARLHPDLRVPEALLNLPGTV